MFTSAEHMVNAWHRAGMFMPIDGGTPFTFTELRNFAETTDHLEGLPWEAETLVEMSRAYLYEFHEGKSPFREAPMERERKINPDGLC